MRTFRSLLALLCFVVLLAIAITTSTAQEATGTAVGELTPSTTDISVGQKVKFSATVKDAAGNKTSAPATAWFAAPFDLAGVDETGTVSFFSPGEVVVGAIVNGKSVLAHVTVKVGPVTSVAVEPPRGPIVVGATTKLVAVARDAQGNPRSDASIDFASSKPDVATVDAAGVVTAVAPGQAHV